MNTLLKGNYLGTQVDNYVHKKIIISKAQYYSLENKDWHCHENAFFAYFLKGGNYEYRESKEIKCLPGTLLYYRSMEPHCNRAYTNGCRIFHVEIENSWFSEYDLPKMKIKADVIDDLMIKNSFVNILREFTIRDELSGSSIETLVVYLFNLLHRCSSRENYAPSWTKKFNLLIKECINNELTLENISKQLNIHPVTLSKEFAKYFRCSFGDYIRRRKIENSLPLLAKKNLPVNEVAFHSGFSDTSNFVRTFKKVKGVTPGAYRQMI